MEYKPIWPTTARDFCSIVATRHIKGSIYAMAAKAVSSITLASVLIIMIRP